MALFGLNGIDDGDSGYLGYAHAAKVDGVCRLQSGDAVPCCLDKRGEKGETNTLERETTIVVTKGKKDRGRVCARFLIRK